jgi:hypothetical protein
VKSIDQVQLEQLLYATHRSTFVALTAVTAPAMRKTKNPHLNARKVSILTGVLCWHYTSTVNRQRAREYRPTDFKALRRSWGRRIKGTPLVTHKRRPSKRDLEDHPHRLYLEVKIERRSVHFFNPDTKKKIQPGRIKPWLIVPSKTRQELDCEITLRDFALENIAEITIGGERYTIAPAAEELQRYFPAPKPTVVKAKAKTPVRRQTPSEPKRSKRGAT